MKPIVISRNNTTFKSGLTKNIIKKEAKINVIEQERMFENVYNTEAFFMENKSAAAANKFCSDIFKEFSKRTKQIFSFPPVIYVYEKGNLIKAQNAGNFCIPETAEILKNNYPFPGRTLFFENFKNLEEINEITERKYYGKISSSPHFLAPFIHEWLHSFHLDYIYKTFGYNGECAYMQECYPKKNNQISGCQLLESLKYKTLSKKENEIVFNTLGVYSTFEQNQYMEIFSEAFTQFICNSLEGIKLVKNPLEEINKTSKDFQAILKKVCSL